MAARKPTKKTPKQLREEKKAKILKLQKGRRKAKPEEPFDLRDARKVFAAAKKHKKVLAEFDLQQSDLDTLDQRIKTAAGLSPGGRVSLSSARSAVKPLLGQYRRAAGLACRSIHGVDTDLKTALRVDVGYPDTDDLLDAYLDGLGPIVTAHSTQLAKRRFKKPQQDAFLEAIDQFRAAFDHKEAAQEQLTEKSKEYEQAYDELRKATSYVRAIGHEAFNDSSRRALFDRPKPTGKRRGKKNVSQQQAAKKSQTGSGGES